MKREKMIEWMTEGHFTIPKVLFNHYTDIGLNEEECMLLLQVHAFQAEGNRFPTPKQLAEGMTFSSEKCASLLRVLIKQKGVLSLKQHRDETNGVYSDSYSLEPLWEKLLSYYFEADQPAQATPQNEDVFTLFEKEFGRPMSPLECESISMWLDDDGHSPTIIKSALKEAVMAGKLNFRYIDRILLEWKKNGIRTPEQAKRYGENFRRTNRNAPSNGSDKKEPFPFYNWLEK
ncbi:MAG TPA: DnaD domain-containing protein [Bacillales bacterium]|nr:DnaD domain-containing protein [Bacillales bacterium]